MWSPLSLLACYHPASSSASAGAADMGCSASHEHLVPDDAYMKVTPEGDAPSRAENSTSLRDDTFSEQHKSVLRSTWQVLSAGDKQATGAQIFLTIFRRRPDAKRLFPFRDLPDDRLQADPLFRSHAMRFMHAVETTVASLDALDLALVPVLHHLGRRHVSIAGFRLDYLPVFMDALLAVVDSRLGSGGRKSSRQVREAWTELGKFIGQKMSEGYYEELALQQVHSTQGQGTSPQHGAASGVTSAVTPQGGCPYQNGGHTAGNVSHTMGNGGHLLGNGADTNGYVIGNGVAMQQKIGTDLNGGVVKDNESNAEGQQGKNGCVNGQNSGTHSGLNGRNGVKGQNGGVADNVLNHDATHCTDISHHMNGTVVDVKEVVISDITRQM